MSTATKSRPIRQYDWEVRAILDGRKTQTRRVVKPQPVHKPEVYLEPGDVIWRCCDLVRLENPRGRNKAAAGWLNCRTLPCPYGKPGDELWVRETWGEVRYVAVAGMRPRDSKIVYRADDPVDRTMRWSPSIHMPRWASRITLTVKAVRVERLQDISEADAYAEGCGSYTPAYVSGGEIVGPDGVMPSDEFVDLWKSINGPDSWDANPWVWVVEFERKQ